MYKIADVVDNNGSTLWDMKHIIGKTYEPKVLEVGKQAVLKNMSDAHIYHRVERTSIVESVVKTFRELHLVTRDAIYILERE